MNPADLPNDANAHESSVFILGSEEYGLFYLPGSHEIVSRLEIVRSADAAPTLRSETRDD